MFKKIISAFLSATLLFAGTSAFSASAAEQNTENTSDDFQQIVIENDGYDTKYYYKNGQEVDINSLETKNNSFDVLPAKYDLRDYGRVTPVRNQGQEGFCWNFASTASIESSILSQPELKKQLGEHPEETLDFSEAGNAWYIYTPVADKNSVLNGDHIQKEHKGSKGASPETISYGLSSGYGTYPEELLPYDSWKNGFNESYRFYSDYKLKEYNDYDRESINSIKSAIVNNGAIVLEYTNYTCNYYMGSDGMQAYYDNGKPIDGRIDYNRHAVAIVGWDDDFSMFRFNPEAKPPCKGAWLCKNSWGTNSCSTAEGYEGYFWLSYETSGLSYSQFIMQSADSYDNVYQNQVSVVGGMKTDSCADVFTATGNETIKQICYQSLGSADIQIEIYKLKKDFTSPVDGALLSSFKSKVQYLGSHTVDCPDEIKLEKGDVFSVVIVNNGYYIGSGGYIEYRTLPPKHGYCKVNSEWIDCGANHRNEYPAIKAYTVNTDGVDKSALSKRTDEAKEYLDESLSEELAERLKQQINVSEQVLADTTLKQYQINNQLCMLNAVIEDITISNYEINSFEDYLALKNNTLDYSKIKNIILNTDLDLSQMPEGETYKPIFSSKDGLTGVFEGNNHTIYNGRFKLYDSGQFCSAFINKISGGTVRNLHFKDFEITGDLNKSILASDVTDAVVENCTFTNCNTESYGNSATIVFGDAGGKIAYKNVKVTDCSVAGEKIGIYNTVFGGAEVSFENCSSSGIKMEGLGKYININNLDNKKIRCINYTNVYSPSITITDDKTLLNEFYGEIKGVKVESDNAEKTDEGYIIDLGDKSDVWVDVEYIGNPNPDYKYRVDYKTRSVVLDKYIGSDIDIIIPDTIDKLPVETIENEFLSETTAKVRSVKIGDNVKTIEDDCFAGCDTLEKVEFGNSVEKVKYFAFSNCPKLKEVTLNEGLKHIEGYAFEKCKSLCNIKLPDSLELLKNYAFQGSGIMSVEFGKNISTIEKNAVGYAYQKCINGKNARLPGFVINGYAGTDAQRYALENDIEFIDLTNSEPKIADKPFDHSVFVKGDVNKDGVVDINDTTLVQKYLVDLVKLDDVQLSNAIVYDSNGEVNINSVTAIQKYIVGIINSLDIIKE